MSKDVNFYDKQKKDDSLEIRTDKDLKLKKQWAGKVFLAVGGVLIVTILFIAAWLNFAKRPVGSSDQSFQYVEISKGESTKQIGQKLKNANLIRSDFAFWFVVRFSMNRTLQAGYYKLSPDMSMDKIIAKINKGDVDAFSLTIPEGYRTLQIGKLIGEKSQIKASDFIAAAAGKEGTLFPDTYTFPINTEPSKIVMQMQENFDEKTATLKPNPDQIILSSIVEREAINDDERPKIAAVYKNRIDNNMLLQADPTVRYGLDTQTYLADKSLDFEFWQPITKAQYQSLNSTFNTYKQRGYPPAPICNPGIKSIQAAVSPEKNFDYLYFFHDKNRQIRFSKTYQEHLENIQKYGVAGS